MLGPDSVGGVIMMSISHLACDSDTVLAQRSDGCEFESNPGSKLSDLEIWRLLK